MNQSIQQRVVCVHLWTYKQLVTEYG